jgi:tRNA (guanine37-N1)-methyltransferase
MRFHVCTLFPEFFSSALASTMLQKAQERGAVEFVLHNVRDYAEDKHRVTDDAPYGGGQGMVMKPEPVVAALEALDTRGERPWRVLLSPQGCRFSQEGAAALAQRPALALVCGRYEGVDERVRQFVDEELSIGDFILSGGEAVSRLVPGVLGCEVSAADESFSHGLLEYPQYTRPPEFRGLVVPEVLRSGDHAAIAHWRRQEALRRTYVRRPDLLAQATLTDEDHAFLATLLRRVDG